MAKDKTPIEALKQRIALVYGITSEAYRLVCVCEKEMKEEGYKYVKNK